MNFRLNTFISIFDYLQCEAKLYFLGKNCECKKCQCCLKIRVVTFRDPLHCSEKQFSNMQLRTMISDGHTSKHRRTTGGRHNGLPDLARRSSPTLDFFRPATHQTLKSFLTKQTISTLSVDWLTVFIKKTWIQSRKHVLETKSISCYEY